MLKPWAVPSRARAIPACPVISDSVYFWVLKFLWLNCGFVMLIFCIYILIFSFRIELISFFRPFLILGDRSNLSTLIRVLFPVCSFL